MNLLTISLIGPVVLCVVSTTSAQSAEWRAVELPIRRDTPLNRIAFATDRIGWISAGTNTILKTTDGGSQWKALQNNLATLGADVSGIWFRDELRGWAAASLGQQPAVLRTDNGGETWLVQQSWRRPSNESLGGMLDIRFADEKHGWAVGFNGENALVVATQDGGEHWRIQFSDSTITGQFSRVQCVDRSNVWVLSQDAAIKSWDGGVHWRLSYYSPALLNSIDVIDHTHIWLAGAWGHLVHSQNASSWSEVQVGSRRERPFLGYVAFMGGRRGWTWGTKCEFFVTEDAGRSWVAEACPSPVSDATEVTLGDFGKGASRLFVIANPGRLLVRVLD